MRKIPKLRARYLFEIKHYKVHLQVSISFYFNSICIQRFRDI